MNKRRAILMRMFLLVGVLALSTVFADPALAQSSGEAQVKNFFQTIANIIAGIAAFVAIIFIMIGGIQYGTSTGDADKLHRAKLTLITASVGLVIVIAAYAIINIVQEAAKGAFGG